MVLFTGQRLGGIALGDQGVAHLGRRQVGVPTRRLELGVGVTMGFHDGADIGRQLRVLVLAARPAACGKILQTADALLRLVQSFLDRLMPPAEAAFGFAGAAVAEFGGDLGEEQPSRVSGQALGTGTKQVIHSGSGRGHGRGFLR